MGEIFVVIVYNGVRCINVEFQRENIHATLAVLFD